MRRWRIEFFEEKTAVRPVQDWLDGLPEKVRGRVLARIDLLAEHGPALDYPYTSQIEGKLREVRLRFGKTRHRALYFFDEKRVGVLLHGFTKDTETLEEADKNIGCLRMNEYLERSRAREAKGNSQKRVRKP